MTVYVVITTVVPDDVVVIAETAVEVHRVGRAPHQEGFEVGFRADFRSPVWQKIRISDDFAKFNQSVATFFELPTIFPRAFPLRKNGVALTSCFNVTISLMAASAPQNRRQFEFFAIEHLKFSRIVGYSKKVATFYAQETLAGADAQRAQPRAPTSPQHESRCRQAAARLALELGGYFAPRKP